MKIQNSLIVVDLETTGIWIEKDKIIEIALIRFSPDGEKETYHKLVNPGMDIPQKVTELTGISNADVANAPTFKELASEVHSFIGQCDFAGFNLERFDLPLLERELFDCGIRFQWRERKIYDAQKVFHLNEKRDLTAAYQFYCGKPLDNAHSALVDSEATYEILREQVKRYGDGADDISVLEQFEYKSNTDFYDKGRKFCWWNDQLYPMFGKYAKKLSLEEIVAKDQPYLRWILKSDFSEPVKKLIQNALEGRFPKRNVTSNTPS